MTAKPNGLDPKHAKNFNPATVRHYYDHWTELEKCYPQGIPAAHKWNMDEKGLQYGGGCQNSGRKYFYFRHRKNRYCIRSDNLELATVTECISAAGNAIPPAFVISKGPIPDIRDIEGVGSVATSDSGWTDRELAVLWFAKLLDVAIFSSVQRRWSDHCSERVAAGVEIDRYNIIHEYMEVRRVMTPELIKSAFRTTGIEPLNTSIFTPEDFGPSMASSTQAHVPETYPNEVSSSPNQYPTNDDDNNLDLDYDDNLDKDNDHDLDGEGDEDDDDDDMREELGGKSKDDVHTEPDVAPETGIPDTTLVPKSSIVTCSSSAAHISLILDSQMSTASLAQDKQKTLPKAIGELCLLRRQMKAYEDLIASLKANGHASDAHCTLARREIGDVCTQLDNVKKKKLRGSTKVKAQFLTHPELKETFEKEEIERQKQQQANVEKEAQKLRDAAERAAQINEDSFLKTFDHSFSHYKKKDDLITIASILRLPTKGTIAALITRLKDHLQDHAELADNPRFSALFSSGRRTRNAANAPTLFEDDTNDNQSIDKPTMYNNLSTFAAPPTTDYTETCGPYSSYSAVPCYQPSSSYQN
ncbi:hypothetical protein C0992_010389 [Termitomyces sp. T32_za158]|nr:hypothetical protein C0992_010389 [Termitomyces sp. T32_za158]